MTTIDTSVANTQLVAAINDGTLEDVQKVADQISDPVWASAASSQSEGGSADARWNEVVWNKDVSGLDDGSLTQLARLVDNRSYTDLVTQGDVRYEQRVIQGPMAWFDHLDGVNAARITLQTGFSSMHALTQREMLADPAEQVAFAKTLLASSKKDISVAAFVEQMKPQTFQSLCSGLTDDGAALAEVWGMNLDPERQSLVMQALRSSGAQTQEAFFARAAKIWSGKSPADVNDREFYLTGLAKQPESVEALLRIWEWGDGPQRGPRATELVNIVAAQVGPQADVLKVRLADAILKRGSTPTDDAKASARTLLESVRTFPVEAVFNGLMPDD